MKVEEIALRHEIRQMMNEAGINKETLKDMVQEILHEELEKAIRQKFHENNIDDFVEHKADKIIRDTTKSVLEQKITDRIVGRYFNKMKVSVDITTEDDKSLISDIKNDSEQTCSNCEYGLNKTNKYPCCDCIGFSKFIPKKTCDNCKRNNFDKSNNNVCKECDFTTLDKWERK